MKKLCLFRHAKSTYGTLGTEDLNRPLHEISSTQIALMADALKNKYKFNPDLIMSSHALRAVTTAEGLADALGYKKQKINIEKGLYEAGVEELLHDIKLADNKFKNLLLVGHNPGLTLLANFLADEHVNNLATCGMFAIGFDTDSWENINTANNKVLFFDEPKNY